MGQDVKYKTVKYAVLLATLLPLFFTTCCHNTFVARNCVLFAGKTTTWPDVKLLISIKLVLDSGSSPMVRNNWISLEPVCMLCPGKQIKEIPTFHVGSRELHFVAIKYTKHNWLRPSLLALITPASGPKQCKKQYEIKWHEFHACSNTRKTRWNFF